MPRPTFEVASGPVNGTNRTFAVSAAYEPGTTAVFLNGQLKKRDNADGWVETNPSGGFVVLDQAPSVGDVVQVFFTALDSRKETEEEVTRIFGVLREIGMLGGSVREIDHVRGKLVLMDTLHSGMWSLVSLSGSVREQVLRGTLTEEDRTT